MQTETPGFEGVPLATLFRVIRPWATEDSKAPQAILSTAERGTSEYRRALRLGARVGHMLTIRDAGRTSTRFVEVTAELLAWLRANVVDTEGDTVLFDAMVVEGTAHVYATHTTVSGSRLLVVIPAAELLEVC